MKKDVSQKWLKSRWKLVVEKLEEQLRSSYGIGYPENNFPDGKFLHYNSCTEYGAELVSAVIPMREELGVMGRGQVVGYKLIVTLSGGGQKKSPNEPDFWGWFTIELAEDKTKGCRNPLGGKRAKSWTTYDIEFCDHVRHADWVFRTSGEKV